MQFQVPQFIDVAPKIVGPLTIKQFTYLAIAAIPVFSLFFILQFWLWLIIAAVIGSAALGLAFFKFNGQPLPHILMSIFNYFWQPRFYLWKKSGAGQPTPKPEISSLPMTLIKNLLLTITTSTKPLSQREKSNRLLSMFQPPKEVLETFRKTTGDREKIKRVDYR